MPSGAQIYARPDLRSRIHQPLRGENAHRLAISGSRHFELLAGGDLITQQVTGLQAPGNDGDTQLTGNGAVQTQGFRARLRIRWLSVHASSDGLIRQGAHYT